MGGDPDLNGSRPLIHHLVYPDLEDLIVVQWPITEDHPMVEVIGGTAQTRHITVVSLTSYHH